MNFLDAKRIVSPDKPVVPGSKEHEDILKMMRESGKIFPEDNVPVVPIPLIRRTNGIERAYVSIERKPVGKKPGLLKEMKVAVASAPAPAGLPYYFVAGEKGKSKLDCKKFKIPPIIIEDGPDERGAEVQTTCTAEGGTGESQSGP
jgi:hypothetical protein